MILRIFLCEFHSEMFQMAPQKAGTLQSAKHTGTASELFLWEYVGHLQVRTSGDAEAMARTVRARHRIPSRAESRRPCFRHRSLKTDTSQGFPQVR